MKILGIDPGLDRMGWAVIEHTRALDTYVASGCITTRRGAHSHERLSALGKELATIITEHQPASAGVEELFFAKNAKTAMIVSEARGVILYVCASTHLRIVSITPNAVKLSVTGSGNADKRQVARMVELLIKLPARKRLDDELDAIAIALATARL